MIELISEKLGPAATVRIIGRIDVETSKELEEACTVWIAQGEKILILDFSKVRYISSWGLRCVLTIGKTLDAEGGSLITCGLSSMVKEVFQISGFDSLFRTYPTLESALTGM